MFSSRSLHFNTSQTCSLYMPVIHTMWSSEHWRNSGNRWYRWHQTPASNKENGRIERTGERTFTPPQGSHRIRRRNKRKNTHWIPTRFKVTVMHRRYRSTLSLWHILRHSTLCLRPQKLSVSLNGGVESRKFNKVHPTDWRQCDTSLEKPDPAYPWLALCPVHRKGPLSCQV